MLALYLAVMAAVRLIAADDVETYNVHGAVAFIRTGERTPVLDPRTQVLTALGAQQMHTLGENFRSRYINELNGPNELGVQIIPGISPDILNNDQLFIQTLDTPYLVSSAQAFMQGLYPPYSLNGTRNGPVADATGILANGTAIDFPMGGYQYPNIQALSQLDPQSVYIAGNLGCPMSRQDSMTYFTTEQFLNTRAAHKSFYQSLDIDWFNGDVQQDMLDYLYATEIYDYLSYAYVHDSNVYDSLANDSTYAGVYDTIRYLADEQAWYLWGNTSSSSLDTDNRAMAGKTLAALVLGQFQKIVANSGNMTNGFSHPLTLLFGEQEPMISLLSLLIVERITPGFKSIPPYGSAIVFELFSTGLNDSFPEETDKLWVRFRYHNGTEYDGRLQAYTMFNGGPSQMDMPWIEFQDMFSRIMTNALSDWCQQCSSGSLFCWGVDNSTVSILLGEEQKHHKVSPAVAGVVGAVVTLAVAGLLFAVAMLLGGIRFHRVQRGKKSELGGFKGSAKLASDADLNLPKNGIAPAGITSFGNGDSKKAGHERVGSWELRQKEFGPKTGDLGDESRRASFEAIETAMSKPVEPTETV